ncbi:hypothetical protein DL96DRAFT_1795876 [Flagelloscypha sp. PMI_526]|nr:hypothetical protein DL96DRAFT_1795876 [Flagelloscypha sp. PMI_526]
MFKLAVASVYLAVSLAAPLSFDIDAICPDAGCPYQGTCYPSASILDDVDISSAKYQALKTCFDNKGARSPAITGNPQDNSSEDYSFSDILSNTYLNNEYDLTSNPLLSSKNTVVDLPVNLIFPPSTRDIRKGHVNIGAPNINTEKHHIAQNVDDEILPPITTHTTYGNVNPGLDRVNLTTDPISLANLKVNDVSLQKVEVNGYGIHNTDEDIPLENKPQEDENALTVDTLRANTGLFDDSTTNHLGYESEHPSSDTADSTILGNPRKGLVHDTGI